jgi:hypothetical protein
LRITDTLRRRAMNVSELVRNLTRSGGEGTGAGVRRGMGNDVQRGSSSGRSSSAFSSGIALALVDEVAEGVDNAARLRRRTRS